MNSPDLIAALKRIKSSLEHARRFRLHPNDWRNAMTQAEGDIEELLIDYGFLASEEREPDSDVSVRVDHQVFDGSIYGVFKNRTLEQAKATLEVVHGAAKLVRVTTITETLERKS